MRDRILAELCDLGETGATGPQLLLSLGIPAEKRSTLYKALRGLVSAGSVTKERRRRFERFVVAGEVRSP